MKSIKKNLLKLSQNIKKSNKNKSSHWYKYKITYNNEFLDINKNHDFGSYENKSYKEIIYFILKGLCLEEKFLKKVF